ncbi:sprouty-related, EVH1 domain-containing protein 3 isoform X1 [Mus musculus]|uniref:sprouty-related, EVH1 domain-containing protein 3 isoform X1 n=1 Tax=Mus musculus TaxID=10090 RepID=UPI0005AB9F23|nr:sprouty-related, EVH1 domain-containing protein 3 isoform X1 [Mus musculus]
MGAIDVRCSPSRALGPSGHVRLPCFYPSPKPPPPPHTSSRFPLPPPSPRLPVPVSSAAGASEGAGEKRRRRRRRRRRPRRRRSEPGRSLPGRYMVRVRAVVMARDDSSGGWLPVGGGGLSQVSVCRVRGARPEGGARQGHYVIHGERLRDQKTTLECTLRPGLVYNKVNPIFHHWSLGDCKFGLTFQSPAEADEFQKSLLAALAALSRGSLTPSSSSSSSSPSQDTAETPCPLTSHVDSDSSSSHSRQETPPTAPIATVESAAAFPLATPPQRRRSSAQVCVCTTWLLGIGLPRTEPCGCWEPKPRCSVSTLLLSSLSNQSS